ncbi:hypothetical protein BCR34DRAFT_628747 [Clohesyomyces aquaticus]|uniref:Glycosyl transferase family 25 domain-containing protein n=1 Tax=Clohesyomyces aquaticus TaxID=1231657 RepID=A0A1Y1YFX1_9PLEO|nr:hypothetical protein BCR34DRAFT_628747 [Clohesyomyces aquaticus]
MPERSDKRDGISLAASVSGIKFDFIDGVDGSKVPEKAIPDSWAKDESNATFGCWRAHMNIMQKIVRQQIQTALIMEDDADWDVHIKDQLIEFSRGTRWVLEQEDKKTHSPYGEGWDLLWIGHCGARNREDIDQRYYVIRDDPTAVPESQWGYRRRQPNFTPAALNSTWTRAVYQPVRGLCTFGYAISLRGAQRLLRDQSLEQALPSDRALNRMCTQIGGNCLASFPTLIGSHKAAGNTNKDSDRTNTTGSYRKQAVTGQIVFSTRLNLQNLIPGATDTVIKSQWPDETLLKETDNSFRMPEGQGVFVTKDEYRDFPRPG